MLNRVFDFEPFYSEYFLLMIDPNAQAFAFQTFGDGDNKHREGHTCLFHSSISDAAKDLQDLNRQGAGVFVTINKTDGKGRTLKNIERVRAVWQDDDNGFEGSFPLEPSLIVETSPGKFQRYWLIDDEWPCDEQGIADFNGVMERIVVDYGGDPNAKDLPRVLRVPGYYHNKGEPHLVRIIGGSDQRYTRGQILEAFPLVQDRPFQIKADSEIDWETEKPRVVDALKLIPSDDRNDWLHVGAALHHASGGASEAYEVWNSWSSSSNKFDLKDQHKTWKGFRENHSRPKTLGSIYEQAIKNGWHDKHNSDFTTGNFASQCLKEGGELTENTMASLREKFEGYGHNPSDKHWMGLEQIARAYEHMANGDLRNNYYISSLPPGMGKTTTLIQATRNLLKDDRYKDKSVIIFLSRLEEIQKLVQEMGLEKKDYSVLTSREEFNSLGNQNKRQARIMFTTQQMLESKCKRYSSFAAMTDFHYEPDAFKVVSQPRGIRVWDEAIVPSMSITLERTKIGKLFDEFGRFNKDLLADIEAFYTTLIDVADRELVTIPDLKNRYNLNEDDVIDLFDSETEKRIVSNLWLLSGRTVRVRKDRSGNTALDYEDILPEDLTPMLILDASGNLRRTYKFWYEDRGGLVKLPSPEKNYSNLTIHHWNKAGGKNAYEGGKGKEQITETAETIRELQGKTLVVHFKQDDRKGIPSFPDEIVKQLRSNPDWLSWNEDDISFLHYGKHTATNDYSEYDNVVLMGILGYQTSIYEAMARGAKGIPAEVELTEKEFREFKIGEIAHHIFQAANRGKVRRAEGDDCPKGCHLYVIAYSNTGVPQTLPQIFPGASVEEWRPILKVNDRIKATGDFILSRALSKGGVEIKNNEIMDHVIPEGGDTNTANFNKTLKHQDLMLYINENGYGYKRDRGKIVVWPLEQKKS